MALTSARFRGNHIFERIHNADTTVYLRINSQGEEVREVQHALLDLGYSIPDGATAFFGDQTAAAVSQFKHDNGLVPNDPVVGVGTITKLDSFFALPFADREEFLSWTSRAFPQWNYSRLNELNRRKMGAPFTFTPLSAWVPAAIRDGMVTGLTELLDPTGSPNGVFSESATWGAGILDLFHCHVVTDLGGLDPSWAEVKVQCEKVHARTLDLMHQADAFGTANDPAWTAAYRSLLLAPPPPNGESFIQMCAAALQAAVANSVAVNQPLKLVWHTFEIQRWRPITMGSDDPRRSWWNTVSPVPDSVTQTPFITSGSQFGDNVFSLLGLAFLVDQTGAITVMAETNVEVAAVVGLDQNTINSFWF